MSQILVIFETPNMTAEQYNLVDNDLRAMRFSKPDGRIFHVAAATENGWYITDVWQSTELLDQFSKVLIPILEKNGVQPVQPRIYPVHNLISNS